MIKQYILVSLLTVFGMVVRAQNADSLYALVKKSKVDSLTIEAFYNFAEEAYPDNTDTLAYFFAKTQIKVAQDPITQGKLQEAFARALKHNRAHYLASRNYQEALALFKKVDSKEDEVRVINSLASLSKIMDHLEEAQTYCFEGLVIAEQMKDYELVTTFLRSIGVNYTKMKSFSNAEKNLKRAIEISTRESDTVGIIYGYMSLGNACKAQDKFEEAEANYLTSLRLAEITNNQRALAGNYNNIASNLKQQNRYNEAIPYYQKAIKINKESGNKVWESYNYNNLGNVYSSLGNYQLALKYQLASYELKKELNDVEGLETSYINLAELYSELGNYKMATTYYDMYVENIENSLIQQNLLNLNELSAKYEDEKKIERLAQLDTLRHLDSLKIVASNESIQKGKSLQRTMWGGVILLLLFVGYLVYSINQKKKVNKALSDTQDILSEKNKDLTDSINYAKHIQQNILTSTQIMREEYEETLILYKPKDIVSGDFYWFKSFQDHFVFALADCTGHGVPGAFMSLICISAINSVTSDSKIGAPGLALSQIDKIVNDTLNGGTEGKGARLADGMDVALCSINQSTGVLQYAGAYRPLIIIRKGEIIRVTADKISIGGGEFVEKVFTEHEIQLEKDDIIYLFSDGFPDQFGGQKRKKLKVGPFLKLLADNHVKSLHEQEKFLEDYLKGWMGDTKQVDDISVIALRYK